MRALASLCLGLTLQLAVPAWADDDVGPGRHRERLIRIGPQALVREDANGRFTMVDEPPPEETLDQKTRDVLLILGATAVFGVILYDAGGVVGTGPPTLVR